MPLGRWLKGSVGLVGLLALSAGSEAKIAVLGEDGLRGKCSPVAVIATIPRGDRIGLNTFEMNDAAKSRFRAAGLLKPPGPGGPTLIVETTILGAAYFIHLKLRRVVSAEGRHIFAIVWEDVAAGFHGGSPHHIMDVLSDHYDHFIETYRMVNRTSCDGR